MKMHVPCVRTPLLILLVFAVNSVYAADCGSLLTDTRKEIARVDFHREWGVQLLSSNDSAFSEANFIAEILEASKPATTGFFGQGHYYRTDLTKHFEEYERLFERTSDLHPIKILRFTNSGTESNNALYEMAEQSFLLRTGKKAQRANLLYFGKPYGGTFGRIAQIGARFNADGAYTREFRLPTPQTRTFSPTDPKEIRRLERLEEGALDFIRFQVADESLEIGGIFIEPISAAPELFVYRPEFMKQLRELADELNVPIFADEILTGGGRTGKFWAYQHYPGFEPDLITFGKGLVASGVAEIKRRSVRGEGIDAIITERWSWPKWNPFYADDDYRYPAVTLDNTSRINPLVLVQAKQVLKRIQSGNLIQNAADVGDYALVSLKQKATQVGIDADEIRGVGLLIFTGSAANAKKLTEGYDVRGYDGRWTPPLTTTTEDFKTILE